MQGAEVIRWLVLTLAVMAGCGPALVSAPDDGESMDGQASTEDVELDVLEPCEGEGCPCSQGTCEDGLTCVLAEECWPCPPGDPGCPCGPLGACVVGSCSEGVDADGTHWSICYPADLPPCDPEPCPGDTVCTDLGVCAWAV